MRSREFPTISTTAPAPQRRFRNKILLYLLLLSFPPLFLGGVFAYVRALDFASGFYERELLTAASEVASRIDWRKQENMAFAKFISYELTASPRASWQDIVTNMTKAEPYLYAIHVMDMTGQNIVRGDGRPLTNYADRRYFQTARDGEGSHELILSRVYDQRPAICSSSPIFSDKPSEKHKVIAVVATCRFIDQNLTQMQNISVGTTGSLFIADSQNEILIHPRLEVRTSQLSEIEKIPLLSGNQNPNGRLEFTTHGKNYVSFRFPLSDSWQLIALQEKTELNMDANNLISIPVMVCAIGLLFALLAAIIAIDRGTKPLLKLAEAARLLGPGNFKVKVPVRSDDEIGVLAAAFNEMADRLRCQFEDLQEKENLLSKSKEELEDQVMRQSQKLLYSTKMSSLGEMAGSIAHEVNNPLAIISLRTQLLKDSLGRGEINKEMILETLEKIDKTCIRITQIVRGLRAFSRDGSQDPMILENLSSIVQDAIALCSETAKSKGIEIVVNCPEDIEVECQPVQIGQVLLNLMSNAKDAVINKGGHKWIEVSARVVGNEAEICVIDNGAGVPPELREKIMQPFFTTKGIGDGTGLGLSISKGILEQHHGSLELDTKHKFTRFILRLPLRQPV